MYIHVCGNCFSSLTYSPLLRGKLKRSHVNYVSRRAGEIARAAHSATGERDDGRALSALSLSLTLSPALTRR